MAKKFLLVLVFLFVAPLLPASGQIAGEYLPGGPSCDDLKARCAALTSDEIYDLANIGTGSNHTSVGVCYLHTQESCPGCYCFDYVKQSWRQGEKGYDGGTGCVGWPDLPSTPEESRLLAGHLLKAMCESGTCCCPQLEPKPCALNFPVRASDPRTGSCCEYPNICTVPPDWNPAVDPHDLNCGRGF